jgi:2,5-furandicarboxylate decarboxylase 1
MDLRELVNLLERKGLLLRVKREVDTEHELSTVVKMLRGRPVLFEKPKGFSMPVVSNLCASRALAGLALDVAPGGLVARLAEAIDHPVEPRIVEPDGYEELPCDLSRLPILKYYPRDGGRYVASGIAVAKDPEFGLNASYHRGMVLDRDRLALRIVERHLFEYIKRGLREFAYCIGNPTPVMIGGAISVAIGTSELSIANALQETPLMKVDDHLVPRSELILVCELTGEQADEGPFLDLTETFDIVRRQPVARVKRILARRSPLFHALLPGDLEHKLLMGMPREPTIFREVAKVCECLDVLVTPGGCSWLHAVVKIKKKDGQEPRRAIEAAFRGHASLKHVWVVDEDIDIGEPADVEWAMATRFQGDRGLLVLEGQQGSSLDPSSDMATKRTTKVGFDLTAPLSSTGKDFCRPRLPLQLDLDDYVGH